MVAEYCYCPRLAYLMWVQGEWADNVETAEGTHVHRRVDKPEGPRAEVHTRSLHLSSETLGLTAVVDVVEREGDRVRPVEYKRGKPPLLPEGAYEPERVQLCAQGLLLRERGYTCHEGILYYAASRERVRIRFTPDLENRTLELVAEMREVLSRQTIPPPLEDSPKCCTAPNFLDTDKHQAASGVKTWVRASAGVRKPSRSMRQWLLYC